jgi:hypothetical protein
MRTLPRRIPLTSVGGVQTTFRDVSRMSSKWREATFPGTEKHSIVS